MATKADPTTEIMTVFYNWKVFFSPAQSGIAFSSIRSLAPLSSELSNWSRQNKASTQRRARLPREESAHVHKSDFHPNQRLTTLDRLSWMVGSNAGVEMAADDDDVGSWIEVPAGLVHGWWVLIWETDAGFVPPFSVFAFFFQKRNDPTVPKWGALEFFRIENNINSINYCI